MEGEEKGYVRQTMIYSQAVMQENRLELPIEPNLFFCRCKLTDLVTTIEMEKETVHDFRAVQEPFYNALTAKVNELMTATEFPPCEPDKCPSCCPFFRLCGRQPKDF